MAVNNNKHGLVDKWLKIVRSAANSGICYLCGVTTSPPCLSICKPCCMDLPFNHSACFACAMPVTAGKYCAHCIQERKPVIDRAICPFRYAYPVDKLIQDMKFRSRLEIAGFFAHFMANVLTSRGTDLPQVLIPVPLHSSRLRERGYNQSLELSRNLSGIMNIPVDNYCLFRKQKTRAQSDLPARQRKKNIRGAFSADIEALSTYEYVAIIDDVITTGATVRETARLIKKSGVKRIDVWSCARAVI